MAKHNKFKKTLFFLKSGIPTEDEIEASIEFEPGVQFRNASLSREDEAIETFDRLAGAIPARYQARADELAGVAAPDAADAPHGAENPAPAAPTRLIKPVAAPSGNPGAGWNRNA